MRDPAESHIPSSRDEPLVSILLASRNGSRYLPEALRSIESQTYRRFELIAVDDGSTDGTGALLAAFAGAPEGTRVLRAEGIGPAAARALAFQHSRGALVAIHDDDDLSMPERLRRQVDFLASHPAHGVVGSAADVIDEGGARMDAFPVPFGEQAIRRVLRRAPPFVNGSVMMRRAAYEEAGGFRAPFRAAEDFDLWLRIPERFAMENLREPLYAWRRHGGNTTARSRGDHLRFAATARAFAEERRDRGEDSVALLESTPDGESFLARYPRGARLSFLIGEHLVREGRVREGRACFARALGAAAGNSARLKATTALWWLLSLAVAFTPRARRAARA
jgi:glycosyltransferase involved in cell wall biosynthesis